MRFRPRYTGLIDNYRDRPPVHDNTRIISLGEGSTPLIRLNNIPRLLGKEVDLYSRRPGSGARDRRHRHPHRQPPVLEQRLDPGQGVRRLVRRMHRRGYPGGPEALTEREGVFCEPASATYLAGAIADIESAKIPEGSSLVCARTGHGLKDPDPAIKQATAPPDHCRGRIGSGQAGDPRQPGGLSGRGPWRG